MADNASSNIRLERKERTGMAQSRIVVLNGGGLRSLAALATVAGRQRVATVFVHDGRTGSDHFHQAAVDQAKHYNVDRTVELALPHLRPPSSVKTLEKPQGYAPMASAQLLLAAAGAAAQMGGTRLIWPVQPGPEYTHLSAVSETIMLVEDLMHTTLGEAAITVETPLLEMTDRQVIEVGHKMDVSWSLARTCLSERAQPCQNCWGCDRRWRAFDEAGIEDPQGPPAGR